MRIALALVGALFGASIELNHYAVESARDAVFDRASSLWVGLSVLAAAAAAAVLLPASAELIRRVAARLGLSERAQRIVARASLLSYLPFLLPLQGIAGRPPDNSPWLELGLFLTVNVAILAVARAASGGSAHGPDSLYFLFFVSGFAAVIYQVVWQRTLFSIYGVNIESTTVVVAIFMLGLGLGALGGGYLSGRFPERLAHLFLGCEMAIGVFGVVSLPLIHALGEATSTSGPLLVSLSIFALLAVPTMLMGATLPILVAHLDRRWGNVGRSVSFLYFINAFGSAVACIATVELLFRALGQQSTTAVAAAANFAVGALTFAFIRSSGRVGRQAHD